MKTKLVLAAAVLALPVVAAQADFLPLDPGTGLIHYTSNSNDGYSSYRGVVFEANEAIVVTGAGLYTKSAGGLNATFRLWRRNMPKYRRLSLPLNAAGSIFYRQEGICRGLRRSPK